MAEQTITLPDGRSLVATHEGEPVGWVIHVRGAEERPVGGRDIADVLTDLLDIDGYPSWLRDAIDQLAGHATPLGRRFACPCCDYLTLDDAPTGTYALCGVCFWEDDGVQFRDPDYEGGANTVSLNQARENYRLHRASEPCFLKNVRPPLPDEQP